MTFFKPTSALLLPLALLAAGCSKLGGKDTAGFKTAKIARADILSAIEATGTLEPEDVVDIGAQVTGQILSFGRDANGKTLDYGSPVEAGQLLATIDDALYTLARQQAAAQFGLAEAGVATAQANLARDTASVAQNEARLEQARAQLSQAEKDWNRARQMENAQALSRSARDTFQGTFESATAAVKAADAACAVARAQAKASEAGIAQAQSAVAQAKVAIALADRNLFYCTITSPVKGIIIDRRVDVGQTVVSNLNASSLFLLAKDLAKMQVWASVNEADIGAIHAGQPVTFTADAFPGRTFQGTVDKVRLNAALTQNVVTYTVEIATANDDRKLLPYLTANVKFEVARQAGALAVPNAALRWQPEESQITPGIENPLAAPTDGKAAPQKGDGKKGGPRKKGAGILWLKDGEKGDHVKPVKVRTGISDGVVTEIIPAEGEAQLEGQDVVIGENRTESAGAAATTNPFAPKMPGGGRR